MISDDVKNTYYQVLALTKIGAKIVEVEPSYGHFLKKRKKANF